MEAIEVQGKIYAGFARWLFPNEPTAVVAIW
jgi:hypothetical protein